MVPSLKTVLLLLKITVGIGATVAAAVVLQAIQQYDLLSTQQDIRRFTVEAARSASEAKIQSEKNNLILEEKVVPKVGP